MIVEVLNDRSVFTNHNEVSICRDFVSDALIANIIEVAEVARLFIGDEVFLFHVTNLP